MATWFEFTEISSNIVYLTPEVTPKKSLFYVETLIISSHVFNLKHIEALFPESKDLCWVDQGRISA